MKNFPHSAKGKSCCGEGGVVKKIDRIADASVAGLGYYFVHLQAKHKSICRYVEIE